MQLVKRIGVNALTDVEVASLCALSLGWKALYAGDLLRHGWVAAAWFEQPPLVDLLRLLGPAAAAELSTDEGLVRWLRATPAAFFVFEWLRHPNRVGLPALPRIDLLGQTERLGRAFFGRPPAVALPAQDSRYLALLARVAPDPGIPGLRALLRARGGLVRDAIRDLAPLLPAARFAVEPATRSELEALIAGLRAALGGESVEALRLDGPLGGFPDLTDRVLAD